MQKAESINTAPWRLDRQPGKYPASGARQDLFWHIVM
jgi:hypothetical protein